MTKPDDIPQDVWDSSINAFNEQPCSWDEDQRYVLYYEPISRAILRERERCAKVGRSAVMKFRGKVGGRYYAGYHEDMRDAVAAAIRDGNEK